MKKKYLTTVLIIPTLSACVAEDGQNDYLLKLSGVYQGKCVTSNHYSFFDTSPIYDSGYISVSGEVINTGYISAGIYIYGNPSAYTSASGTITAESSGLYIYSGNEVGGNIINSGTIYPSDYSGIYVYGDVDYSPFSDTLFVQETFVQETLEFDGTNAYVSSLNYYSDEACTQATLPIRQMFTTYFNSEGKTETDDGKTAYIINLFHDEELQIKYRVNIASIQKGVLFFGDFKMLEPLEIPTTLNYDIPFYKISED